MARRMGEGATQTPPSPTTWRSTRVKVDAVREAGAGKAYVPDRTDERRAPLSPAVAVTSTPPTNGSSLDGRNGYTGWKGVVGTR